MYVCVRTRPYAHSRMLIIGTKEDRDKFLFSLEGGINIVLQTEKKNLENLKTLFPKERHINDQGAYEKEKSLLLWIIRAIKDNSLLQ